MPSTTVKHRSYARRNVHPRGLRHTDDTGRAIQAGVADNACFVAAEGEPTGGRMAIKPPAMPLPT